MSELLTKPVGVDALDKKYGPTLNKWPLKCSDVANNFLWTIKYYADLSQIYREDNRIDEAKSYDEDVELQRRLLKNVLEGDGREAYQDCMDRHRGRHNQMAIFSNAINHTETTEKGKGILIEAYLSHLYQRGWYGAAADIIAKENNIPHANFRYSIDRYNSNADQIRTTQVVPDIPPFLKVI